MKDIDRNDLVILDEFGYVPIDVESARLLFQVVSACYERRGMIFTTNIEFSKWGDDPGGRQTRGGDDRQDRASWEAHRVRGDRATAWMRR